ncbi:hypothetical protein Esti_004445 [Eimeria stiedai]
MLGENPIRPQDLDLIDVFPPTPTPPMTKAFRILVDQASAPLEQAKRNQKAFADASRRPLEFSERDLVPQDMASPAEWEPISKVSDGLPIYEVQSILDQQGEGDAARYLVKWKGFPDSEATWEPLSNLDNYTALLRALRASWALDFVVRRSLCSPAECVCFIAVSLTRLAHGR